MDSLSRDQLSGLPGDDLPQIVPSDICLRCDVCCRFPERHSVLRPYFTAEERRRAIAYGAPEGNFPDVDGGRIVLTAHPTGEGYLCPCFDPVTQFCAIYPVRPLDCRLYPLALMRDSEGQALIMGLDTKCPYVQDAQQGLRLAEYARRVADLMRTPSFRAVVLAHGELVGPFQDDVTPTCELGPLPRSGPVS